MSDPPISGSGVRSQPMPRRRLTRDESQARTRTELLRAANRLFLRDGYAATSLAAIAEEAAVTKGAVYSNFESKEDLFLALLREYDSGAEWYAPHDVSDMSGEGPDERAQSFGRHAAGIQPSRRQVALFLEMNAAALRSERVRRWVAANNDRFFESFGAGFADALGIEVDDPRRLGLIAQSIYVGLMMHGAFDGGADGEAFVDAYRLLAMLATE
jgi:AcrR family transcriptional regulator